jgi:hypothetical protein
VTYIDSDPETAGITFSGIWVHDPVDPEGSVRQFPYGDVNALSSSIAVDQAGAHYAGRTHPVYDFGEHQTDTLAVTLYVPEETWTADMAALREFAEARRVLVVRDTRGRVVHGALGGYAETDQTWGTQVVFTVTRADYTVT